MVAATQRLVLRRAARVRMVVAGLPADCRTDFACSLEPIDGRSPAVPVDVDFSNPDLRLPAGQWDFVVRYADEELLRIDRLRLDAGVENHDPRFMAFDWRQFATLVTVRVEDADGKPSAECMVWQKTRNGATGWSLAADGATSLLVPKAGAHLEIEPTDKRYPRIDLGVVVGERLVRLGAGPPLTVKLSSMPQLPDGAKLLVRVNDGHDGVELGAEGARVWLPRPGEHRIALAVRKADQVRALTWSKLVDVGAGGATVDIEMTEALLAEIQAAAR